MDSSSRLRFTENPSVIKSFMIDSYGSFNVVIVHFDGPKLGMQKAFLWGQYKAKITSKGLNG